MTNLETLLVYSNQLSGTLSSRVGSLPNLENVALNQNVSLDAIQYSCGGVYWTGGSCYLFCSYLYQVLSGSLPTELGLATRMTTLVTLANKALSGPLPSQLGRLERMKYMLALDCSLSGSIPTELGLLTRMNELYVEVNVSYHGFALLESSDLCLPLTYVD